MAEPVSIPAGRRIPFNVPDGFSVSVMVLPSQPVSYSDTETGSALGTLSVGQSLVLPGDYWFFSPTGGALSVSRTSTAAQPAGSSSLRVVALGNMGATPTLALNTGDKDVLVTGTLTANATLTVTGLTAGVSITLVLTQDGTGSRTFVFSPTAKKVGGQALPFSTTAGAVDVVTAFSPDGTSLFAFLSGRGMA